MESVNISLSDLLLAAISNQVYRVSRVPWLTARQMLKEEKKKTNQITANVVLLLWLAASKPLDDVAIVPDH